MEYSFLKDSNDCLDSSYICHSDSILSSHLTWVFLLPLGYQGSGISTCLSSQNLSFLIDSWCYCFGLWLTSALIFIVFCWFWVWFLLFTTLRCIARCLLHHSWALSATNFHFRMLRGIPQVHLNCFCTFESMILKISPIFLWWLTAYLKVCGSFSHFHGCFCCWFPVSFYYDAIR